MTSVDPSVWQNLAKPLGEGLIARLAFPETTRRLFCALDSRSQRHFLIPLAPEADEYFDTNSRGISVRTRELVIHGHTLNKYLDLQCLDEAGHSAFDLIGGEIAEDLHDDVLQPHEVVKRVLTRWRRFWGNVPQQLLSKSEQIGLFGELWFITVWLIPNLGPNAIMAWQGPWGSRNDFEWKERAVEVKATTNVRGRIFKINGVNQLENFSGGQLLFVSICLREDVNSSNNLPSLVGQCRNLLAETEEPLNHFENALAQIGYSPLHENEYAKLNLRVVEDVIFQVVGNFPKITNDSFPAGISPGVERVDYEINLNTFNDLVIATRPDQLKFS